MVVNQLKVHPFQRSGFRWVNLHPYTSGAVDVTGGEPEEGMSAYTVRW